MAEEKRVLKEIKENIIEIAKDIVVTVNESNIILEKSGIKQEVKYNPVYLIVKFVNGNLIITPKNKRRRFTSVSNTIRKLVNNAIEGFEKEYIYTLAIVFSHFPMTVKLNGSEILISNFLGEKKPRVTKITPGCTVEIKGKEIIVKGRNKYAVGQTAGSLESTARVRGRDYRVFDDGIYITGKNI